MRITRTRLVILFCGALAWAQFRESGDGRLSAHLTIQMQPPMPVRVYLFKDSTPFRLSPVDAMLPLRTDLFYRERLWKRTSDPATLEVTCRDQSHFLLLKGRGEYQMPQGKYRVEAYRGLFYKPVAVEFELKAGQDKQITLHMENWAGDEAGQWLSGDDHIHLVREASDDPVFLAWLQAEDLNVANFLQLQRQMDAAVQYGFGPKAEAKRRGYSVRSGHESRCEFFGHVNLLGGRELIRPLSTGTMYGNEPAAYPYPSILFEKGRGLGALTGYAHFDGSMPHSTLLMDLALGDIDFIEVFQDGQLKDESWYGLLNAGFEIRGVAGSDFPANFGKRGLNARYVPMLGPERTLVRARPGASAYEAWADGIRRGEVIVTNGPLVRLEVKGKTATASARFWRPLTKLEVVADGRAIAVAGNGASRELSVSVLIPDSAVWVAARTWGATEPDEPQMRAHTNPKFLRHAVADRIARRAFANHWADEIKFYKEQKYLFPERGQSDTFFRDAKTALDTLLIER